MYLKKLSLINFKNIREENLEFRPGINCFVGDNGAGKTNVIDAVYFLSMCKSSLAMTDGQNMRHGSDFFLLDGQSCAPSPAKEAKPSSATARSTNDSRTTWD